jgi:hypothetical protein
MPVQERVPRVACETPLVGIGVGAAPVVGAQRCAWMGSASASENALFPRSRYTAFPGFQVVAERPES